MQIYPQYWRFYLRFNYVCSFFSYLFTLCLHIYMYNTIPILYILSVLKISELFYILYNIYIGVVAEEELFLFPVLNRMICQSFLNTSLCKLLYQMSYFVYQNMFLKKLTWKQVDFLNELSRFQSKYEILIMKSSFTWYIHTTNSLHDIFTRQMIRKSTSNNCFTTRQTINQFPYKFTYKHLAILVYIMRNYIIQ